MSQNNNGIDPDFKGCLWLIGLIILFVIAISIVGAIFPGSTDWFTG